MTFKSILDYIYLLLLLVNLLVLLSKFNILGRYRIFVAIIGISFVTEVFKKVVGQVPYRPAINHLYIPTELLLLVIYYFMLLQTRTYRVVTLSLGLLALAILIYLNIRENGIWMKPDYSDFVVCGIAVCVFVGVFFMELFNQKEYIELKNYPDFWINAANLLFYGGCLFVMGMNGYVRSYNPDLAKQLWSINNTLNLLLYILYLVGFLCIKKKPSYL